MIVDTKTDPYGNFISRAMITPTEQNCHKCKAEINFGQTIFMCELEDKILACKKCIRDKKYICPSTEHQRHFEHTDLCGTLVKQELPKKEEEKKDE